jgi:hypothetical protein
LVALASATAVTLSVLVVVASVSGTHNVSVFVVTGKVVVIVFPALIFFVSVDVMPTVIKRREVIDTVVVGAVEIVVEVDVPRALSWIVIVGASGPRFWRVRLTKPVDWEDAGRPVSRGRRSPSRPWRSTVARRPGRVTEMRRLMGSATRAVGAAVVGQGRVRVDVATMLVVVLVCVRVMRARVVSARGGNKGVMVRVAA